MASIRKARFFPLKIACVFPVNSLLRQFGPGKKVVRVCIFRFVFFRVRSYVVPKFALGELRIPQRSYICQRAYTCLRVFVC